MRSHYTTHFSHQHLLPPERKMQTSKILSDTLNRFSRTDTPPPEFLLFCFVWLLRELCWLQMSLLNGSQFPIKNAHRPWTLAFAFPPRGQILIYSFFFLFVLPLSIICVCICHLFSIKHVSRTWVTSLTKWKFLMWCDWAQNDPSEILKAKYLCELPNAFFVLTAMETQYHFLNTFNMRRL